MVQWSRHREDRCMPLHSAPAARAQDLKKIYGTGETAVHALDGVTADFAAGEFTAIMGPSGSGKSTLMHCLAGLDSATSGAVFIGDTDLTTLSDKGMTQLRRDRIGFVFQAFNLVPTLTALENITLPVDIAGRKVDQEWLDPLLEDIGRHADLMLAGDGSQFMNKLTGQASTPKAEKPAPKAKSHIHQARSHKPAIEPTGPMAAMLKKLMGKE